MTVSAVFTADFSSFQDQVSKSLVTLADFSKGAKTAQERLDGMNDRFAGKRLIQDATLAAQAISDLGGASTLTAKELTQVGTQAKEAIAKMKLLGLEPPANLKKIADAAKETGGSFANLLGTASKLASGLGIAFSVGAVVSFGRAVLADADALVKLSDKTGITIGGLQKFQVAGDDAGNTLDEITGAVTKMQDKLVSGDASAVGALKKLGLSLDEIRQLSPEKQFITISDAIRGIHDPSQQVAIAIDLFGKAGASVLPTLKRGFDDLKGSAVGMSEESVRALDKFGDALAAAARKGKAFVGEFLGNLIQQLTITGGIIPEATLQVHRLIETLQSPNLLKTGGKNGQSAVAFGLPSEDELKAMGLGIDQIRKKTTDLAAEREKLAKAAEKAREQEEKLTKAFVDQVESASELKFKTLGLADALKAVGGSQFTPTIKDIGSTSLRSATDVAGLSGSVEDLQRAGDFTEAALKKMGTTIGVLPARTKTAVETFREGAAATDDWRAELNDLAQTMTQFAQISGDSFGGLIKDLANIIVSWNAASKAAHNYAEATTASGKAMALFQGAVAIAQATTPHTDTTLNRDGTIRVDEHRATTTAGGAVSGATLGFEIGGPWGALVGGAIGGIVGWYRSGKAEKEVNKVRQAFVDTSGGLDQLNKHAHDAGTNLDALLNAKSPEEYNKAITALNETMARHDAQVKRVSDGVMGLSSAWHDAGEYIPSDIQGMVDELSTMNGLTAEQQTLLAEMSSAAEPNYKKLIQLAGTYGITLDGLGPKFQQANISDTAQQIFKDFDQLTKAGADVGGVLSGMADEIQDLITNSQRFGAVIPENMRPLIENLIAAGRLTDDAGVALTDVSQIRFGATPLDRSTSAIVDAVHELRDALLALPENAARAAAGVQGAFDNIHINQPPAPNRTLDGDAMSFANGTRGRVLNFGTGTLAMLHGHERVQTAAEIGRSGSADVSGMQEQLEDLNRYLTQDFAREVSGLLRKRVA